MTPHDCYVEAFCGAGAIYLAKKPAKTEVINDINNELITLFRVIKCHPDEFYRQFKHSLGLEIHSKPIKYSMGKGEIIGY